MNGAVVRAENCPPWINVMGKTVEAKRWGWYLLVITHLEMDAFGL